MNRKLVQMLRDMLEGIPEKRIFLGSVYPDDKCGLRGYPRPCGTVACIAGWALLYPPFVELGIRNFGFFPTEKCSKFFGVSNDGPFNVRMPHEKGTDKEIALRRLDKLLAR